MKGLNDSLNAEIIAGTINDMNEAISWFKLTYLYIRMGKNPLHYGITYEKRESDPSLWETCEYADHSSSPSSVGKPSEKQPRN